MCIKDVVRDGDGLYVHFAVTNNSALPYRVLSPTVFEIAPQQSADLLPSMKDEQISDKAVSQFQSNQTAQVTVRRTDIPQKDLSPGATAEGVVEIQPEDMQKPGVYEFVFGGDGDHCYQGDGGALMAELEFITPEEARARLLIAYRRSGDESFVETLRRPFLNPVEQRNAAGKRNLHPLLLVGLVLLVLAGASMIFFSFHIRGL